MQYIDALDGEDLLLTGEVKWRPLVEENAQSILKVVTPTYNDTGLWDSETDSCFLSSKVLFSDLLPLQCPSLLPRFHFFLSLIMPPLPLLLLSSLSCSLCPVRRGFKSDIKSDVCCLFLSSCTPKQFFLSSFRSLFLEVQYSPARKSGIFFTHNPSYKPRNHQQQASQKPGNAMHHHPET